MRRDSHQPLQSTSAEHQLRDTIAMLRDEEETLREEIRQLRAAVQIYNEVAARLAQRTRQPRGRAHAA